MSDFVEVNTAELVGTALDWAMAEAEGLKHKQVVDDHFGGKVVMIINDGQCKPLSAGRRYSKVETTWSWFGLVKETREIVLGWAYEPSVDWAQGGPLLDEYGIELQVIKVGLTYKPYYCAYHQSDIHKYTKGNTALIAICRTVVTIKIGETVKVPAKLVNHDNT